VLVTKLKDFFQGANQRRRTRDVSIPMRAFKWGSPATPYQTSLRYGCILPC